MPVAETVPHLNSLMDDIVQINSHLDKISCYVLRKNEQKKITNALLIATEPATTALSC